MTPDTQTLRGRILNEARRATEGDRNRLYGDPVIQLELAGFLKAAARERYDEAGRPRTICDAEWEAIDSTLTKISRIILGPVVHRDSYVDAAAYMAIAGECALRSARLEEQAQAYEEDINDVR